MPRDYKIKRPVILIGGAPATGKSTLASNLSKHLGIPWMSTDQMREYTKFFASKEDYPMIFDTADHTAESYHAKYSAQDIIDGDYEQSVELWPFIKHFIKNDFSFTEGFIIEGVNIVPKLVAGDPIGMDNVQAIFVIDEDDERTRKTVYERGVWDDADTYPDHIKEAEITWVTLAAKTTKQECEAFGIPCLSIEKDTDKDLQNALSLLGFK